MSRRYVNVKYFINNNPLYENVFEERGVPYIRQYGTTTYRPLTTAQRNTLTIEEAYWQPGDRLDKLASRVYGNPTYWWIIARYNGKPTDAHYRAGDLIYMPQPLNLILGYYTS